MSMYNDFNFRPNSGRGWSDLSSRRSHKPGRPYSRNQNTTHAGRQQTPTEPTATNHPGVSQSKANDDEITAYAVNLQLKPVEMGFEAGNKRWQYRFNGLGAFNRYFGLLSPTNSLGYTLPDIWDGYFHITLAKFCTAYSPDQLENKFKAFRPSIEDLPHIPDIVFQSSNIVRFSGENRSKGRAGIDFIVLPINRHDQTDSFYQQVQPLLHQIKERSNAEKDWNLTQLDQLHVTIRKYSNVNFDICNIPIDQYPIEFRCSHFEIKQTREQARNRYKYAINNGYSRYQWWSGVTEIDGKCSGCDTPVLAGQWEGFCIACGQYESILPLWSTTGNDNWNL
ncbi:unnamed protein product [Rotaria sordida]|uniref:Uncharacterized protein n=1 Tax=Rotaria sordida TaxID=392033 RepID=A0A815B5M9_9BILA|nr:unnamed protein product [Rotaria sordida]CAF3792012.1 unnamed protein product [Rotaria sordida]